MIKELGLIGACFSSVVGGVRSSPTRSHEVVEDGMSITYKYDTNEVDSLSDIVNGNAYHFDFNNIDPYTLIYDGYIDIKFFNIDSYNLENFNYDESIYSSYEDYGIITAFLNINNSGAELSLYLTSNGDNDYFSRYTLDPQDTFNLVGDGVIYMYDFQTDSNYLVNHTSICENIPIESVERVYPDNIFGYVSEFIDENILNGIPNIDEVSSSIGGKTITLRSWLNTSICVVLACLLISVLIWFIRYLFRLFGGLLS